MRIEKATGVTDDLLAALQRLIPQLNGTTFAPTRTHLQRVLDTEGSTLFIAKASDAVQEVVGLLSLTIYPVPTGMRAIVEDVIVDEKFRNRGIAQALLNVAIESAKAAGASGVSLTSNPSRAAANRLYQKMGFVKRETNSYYFDLRK